MSGLGNLLAVLRGLGPLRLAALGGVGLATLGLLGFLVLRSNEPPMALLYGDLDQRDAGQVVAALERARVPHRIGRGGAEVMVPTDQVARLRLQLARDGIPAGGSVGYEIFDRSGGLIRSDTICEYVKLYIHPPIVVIDSETALVRRFSASKPSFARFCKAS